MAGIGTLSSADGGLTGEEAPERVLLIVAESRRKQFDCVRVGEPHEGGFVDGAAVDACPQRVGALAVAALGRARASHAAFERGVAVEAGARMARHPMNVSKKSEAAG